jgi:hypothetical protein
MSPDEQDRPTDGLSADQKQAPEESSAQTQPGGDEEKIPEEAVGGRSMAPSTLEEQLDIYPLREKSEDPRWAIGIVWTWVGVALFSIFGILLLILLGFFYR